MLLITHRWRSHCRHSGIGAAVRNGHGAGARIAQLQNGAAPAENAAGGVVVGMMRRRLQCRCSMFLLACLLHKLAWRSQADRLYRREQGPTNIGLLLA